MIWGGTFSGRQRMVTYGKMQVATTAQSRCSQLVCIKTVAPIKKGFISLIQEDTRIKGLLKQLLSTGRGQVFLVELCCAKVV